jgi:hypothetical protein
MAGMNFQSKNRKIPLFDNNKNHNILNELKTRSVFCQSTTIQTNRQYLLVELIDPESSNLLLDVSQQEKRKRSDQ